MKGGTVLIHNNEKEFWFIIVINVRFFFSLLKSNFHDFFSLLRKRKKRRFSFSESDLRTFKTHKKKVDLESKNYSVNEAMMTFEKRV